MRHLSKLFVIIFYRIAFIFSGFLILAFIFSIIEFYSTPGDNFKTNISSSKTIESTTSELVTNKLYWKDYDNDDYYEYFSIKYFDYLSSLKYKNGLLYVSSYSELYEKVSKYDKNKITLIYNTLNQIRIDENMNKRKFAEVLVSFVQTIPYSLVMRDNCDSAYSSDQNVRKMINDGVSCDGPVYAGVYSPIEFIKNFKGDCDSRTLFLYTLFKKFNYDIVILNSDLYAHSIIGVNLPSTGRYKTYLGKRYYTWETTNKGWQLGVLPPTANIMKYWYVALAS